MLFITSLVGSLIGFSVCYRLMSKRAERIPHSIRMKMCMGNSMALSFLFTMFVETTTGSKWVSVLISLIVIGITLYFIFGPRHSLDMMEAILSVIMGTAMGVMLLGMMSLGAIWILQLGTLGVEMFLWWILQRKRGWG